MADPSKQNSPRRLIILLALLFLILLGAGYGTYYYYKTATETQQVAEVPKVKTKKDVKKKSKKKQSKKVSKIEDKETTKDKKELIESIPDSKIAEKLKDVDEKLTKVTEKTEKDVEELLHPKDKTKKEPDIKLAKEKEVVDLSNPLNQMPYRLKQIQSYFAPEPKNIITVEETGFKSLQEEAFAKAGKYDPFIHTEKVPELPELNKKNLPEIIETINETLKLQPGGEGPDLPDMPESMGPDSIITSTTADSEMLDTTKFAGTIGDAAILKFNGISRALKAGQNYHGIVVLSVDPNSVTLELNGYTVTKTLKN